MNVVTTVVRGLLVIGWLAGVLVSPRDWRGLAAGIARWLENPDERRHFRQAGLERAAEFSWERAANETQTVYDEVFQNWQRGRANKT